MYIFQYLYQIVYFKKKKNHVEGFAPEVAYVTEAGGEKLDEKLCIRPTS